MAEQGTRVKYVGPIDGVVVELDRPGRGVEVARLGEVDLADHLNAQDARRRAKALVGTGDWTFVQRDTKDDAAGASADGETT